MVNLPKVNNPGKLAGVLVVLIFAGVGLLTSHITAGEWIAVSGPTLGYLLGNGIAARRGDPVEPVFGQTLRRRRTDRKG